MKNLVKVTNRDRDIFSACQTLDKLGFYKNNGKDNSKEIKKFSKVLDKELKKLNIGELNVDTHGYDSDIGKHIVNKERVHKRVGLMNVKIIKRDEGWFVKDESGFVGTTFHSTSKKAFDDYMSK